MTLRLRDAEPAAQLTPRTLAAQQIGVGYDNDVVEGATALHDRLINLRSTPRSVLDVALAAIESAEIDPQASLIKSRLVLETRLNDLYRTRVPHAPPRIDIATIMSDDAFATSIPERVVRSIDVVRRLGNKGAHEIHVWTDDAVRAREELVTFLEWCDGAASLSDEQIEPPKSTQDTHTTQQSPHQHAPSLDELVTDLVAELFTAGAKHFFGGSRQVETKPEPVSNRGPIIVIFVVLGLAFFILLLSQQQETSAVVSQAPALEGQAATNRGPHAPAEPRPNFLGAFVAYSPGNRSVRYELHLWEDRRGIFGELLLPVFQPGSPRSRLHYVALNRRTGKFRFRTRLNGESIAFSGTRRRESISGLLVRAQRREQVIFHNIGRSKAHGIPGQMYASRAQFENAIDLLERQQRRNGG